MQTGNSREALHTWAEAKLIGLSKEWTKDGHFLVIS